MVVVPGRTAVTWAVRSPVVATVAIPGLRVPQTTGSSTGLPLASTIDAVSTVVPAIGSVSATGATVTTTDPRVALIGASPASGMSTSEMIGFVPATIVTV